MIAEKLSLLFETAIFNGAHSVCKAVGNRIDLRHGRGSQNFRSSLYSSLRPPWWHIPRYFLSINLEMRRGSTCRDFLIG